MCMSYEYSFFPFLCLSLSFLSFLLRIYCSECVSSAQYGDDAQDLFFTAADTIQSSLFRLSLFSLYARLHIIIYIQLHRSICIYTCLTQCTSSLLYIKYIDKLILIHKTYSRLINCTTHSFIRAHIYI
jgi:hypothetical protein